jgi:hypothetical protein
MGNETPSTTPLSLEDRVRRLERFRYSVIGRSNAYETLILDLWMQIVEKTDGPVAMAEEMQRVG